MKAVKILENPQNWRCWKQTHFVDFVNFSTQNNPAWGSSPQENTVKIRGFSQKDSDYYSWLPVICLCQLQSVDSAKVFW